MSSQDKNLSDLNYHLEGDTSEMRIAIVVSEWNADITERLLDGCKTALRKLEVEDRHIRIIRVPGAFELPIGAQMLLEECDPLPSAVICLGCIIKGETDHFKFVSHSVSSGVKDISLKYNLPVIFGVLTDDNKEQSLDRSGGALGNKGEEAAVTAVQMALLQRKLRR